MLLMGVCIDELNLDMFSDAEPCLQTCGHEQFHKPKKSQKPCQHLIQVKIL